MANIKGLVNKIRTAIQGKEVRGSLADGLEAVNKETEEATVVSKQTEHRQGAVEQQFDNVLNGWASEKPVDNAMTLAALVNRDTGESFNTIGERLDKENLNLTKVIADRTNHLLNKLPLNVFNTTGGVLGELAMRAVNPVWFGAKPDKARVYTPEFNAAIQYLKSIGGGTLKIPAGEWRTELLLGYDLRTQQWGGGDGITVEGVGKDTILTLLPEDQSIGGELIAVRGFNKAQKLKCIAVRNLTVRNLESAVNAGNGIGITQTEKVLLDNVFAEECSNYGIVVESESEDIKINNVTANRNEKSGLALTSSSTRRITVSNLTAQYNTEHGLYCSYNSGKGMDELVIIAPNIRFNGKSGVFGSHFDSSQIVGGVVSDNGEEGVYLHGSKGAKFIGTTIQRNALEGVRLSNSYHTALIGVNVADNAEYALIKVGVRLHNLTDRVTITNSFIGNIDTTNQAHGIRIDATNVVVNENTYANTGASVVIGTGYVAKIDGVFCDSNIPGSVPVNLNRRIFKGIDVPTAGTFERGDLILNVSPTNAGPIGWTCINSGSPGSWKSFGSRAAAQGDCIATTVPGMVADFNILLKKLRDAGILNT